ncbi:hypothetical protein RFI_07057 [Reticulomyxa filosa]|uniref:LysM domain-containing protein n=1 Tax=Reticulomyxa filosa TaxID=46433 RepID=X6NW61_RETFI|nr:hypothetical protein RFI_07057 [Reticulomyxa filosa]|eukprot:ETO30064.1 hypothetical protein RFI_07057 [Reticulomyxa filosa]
MIALLVENIMKGLTAFITILVRYPIDMFHIPLPVKEKEVSYGNLKLPPENGEAEGKTPQWPDEDGSVPKAPAGFMFYRVTKAEEKMNTQKSTFNYYEQIEEGDSLLSLSLRFGVSQSRLRKFNREACFGHQLGHMVGKLLLVPLDNKINLTLEASEDIEKTKESDEQAKKDQMRQSRPEDDEPKEPDEDGKYNLRKVLQYYACEVDDQRANYYLGEANWNVRQALKLYREDNQWEKQSQLCQAVPGLSAQQAREILELCDYSVSRAINYCKSKSMTRKLKEKKQSLLLPNSNAIGSKNIQQPSPNYRTGWKKHFLCL